jgi:nucleoid-associated protein YgaU
VADSRFGREDADRREQVQRRNKLIVAVAVLAAGIALALEFRKTGADPSALGPDAAPAHAAAAGNSAASDVAQSQPAAPTQQKTAFDGGIEPSVVRAAAPTGSSAAFGSIATGAPNVASPSAGLPSRDMPMVDLNPPERTHKIVDGDTLPALAQRYLGRADRYQELFECNRDVLKSPEILPIGAELRIPSSGPLPAADNGAATLVPLSNSPTGSDAPPPLAPLPKTPVTPAAASQPRSPRTYTVQPGDNLVDIARKLYGDGRRHEALFEANRRTLRTPGDLKPGMVLVVP